MTEITCPECHGEKYYDVMTFLSYEGDTRWKQISCETCNGNGWIEDRRGDDWRVTINKAITLLETIDEPDASEYNNEFSLAIDGAIAELIEAKDRIKEVQNG